MLATFADLKWCMWRVDGHGERYVWCRPFVSVFKIFKFDIYIKYFLCVAPFLPISSGIWVEKD